MRRSVRGWPWRQRLQQLTSLLLLVLMLFALAGGRCRYRDDDDNDDDHFCGFDDDDVNCDDDDDFDDDAFSDDDDVFIVIESQSTPTSFQLQDYELVASDEADRHPVAELRNIRGIGLFDLLGAGTYTDEDFEGLTRRLLRVNESLLGLGYGVRKLQGVRYRHRSIEVVYEQWDRPHGSALDHATTVFEFDGFGNLQNVINQVWDAPRAWQHTPR